jgi:hypothetical protein
MEKIYESPQSEIKRKGGNKMNDLIYTKVESNKVDGDKIGKLINNSALAKDDDCWWLLYNQNKVQVGKGSNRIIMKEIDPDILMEFRLFSQMGELHIWKGKTGFSYRECIDSLDKINGFKETNIYEETHFLTKIKKNKNDEGFEFIGDSDTVPEKVLIRNYYFDETGYIKFYDARLVEVTEKKGGN